MIEERLLGFDVREGAGGAGLWYAARRELFLLRPQVALPLSTDTLVWPSVFDSGQGNGLPATERTRLRLAGVPLPAYIGPNAGLWQDKASLLTYLAEHWPAPRPASLIAISWLSPDRFAEAGPYGPYLDETVPAATAAGRTLLGFDVADGSLLSGLSNCGYREDERSALRERWAAELNDHHLFAAPGPAFEFRGLTDERVPAHAPFFVYGLYLVEQI